MMTYEQLAEKSPAIEQAYHLHDYDAFKLAIIIAYSQGKHDGWKTAHDAAFRKDMKMLDDLEEKLRGGR